MNQRTVLLISLVTLGALTRLIPHSPNFTSVGAVAIFAAFTLRRTWLAYLAPVAAILLSDAALYFTDEHYSFGWINLFVLAGFCMTVFGSRYLKKATLAGVGGCMLGSAVIFFLVTNFGVWIMGGGFHYPLTLEGLVATCAVGIPFFWSTLAGTLFYGTCLFAALKLAESALPGLRAESAPV